MIPHQNVVRLLGATDHWFQFDADDVDDVQFIHLDFSVWEIWGPLLYGGRLVVVPHICKSLAERIFTTATRKR